jgi:hypothetical protein
VHGVEPQKVFEPGARRCPRRRHLDVVPVVNDAKDVASDGRIPSVRCVSSCGPSLWAAGGTGQTPEHLERVDPRVMAVAQTIWTAYARPGPVSGSRSAPAAPDDPQRVRGFALGRQTEHGSGCAGRRTAGTTRARRPRPVRALCRHRDVPRPERWGVGSWISLVYFDPRTSDLTRPGNLGGHGALHPRPGETGDDRAALDLGSSARSGRKNRPFRELSPATRTWSRGSPGDRAASARTWGRGERVLLGLRNLHQYRPDHAFSTWLYKLTGITSWTGRGV